MISLVLLRSINGQACIEVVPIEDKDPNGMLCDKAMDNQSCLQDDSDGDYSVATSISLAGEITGVGMSYTLVSVDLGLPVNLVAEVVYIETIYSRDN
jgi:hypothetical protein